MDRCLVFFGLSLSLSSPPSSCSYQDLIFLSFLSLCPSSPLLYLALWQDSATQLPVCTDIWYFWDSPLHTSPFQWSLHPWFLLIAWATTCYFSYCFLGAKLHLPYFFIFLSLVVGSLFFFLLRVISLSSPTAAVNRSTLRSWILTLSCQVVFQTWNRAF